MLDQARIARALVMGLLHVLEHFFDGSHSEIRLSGTTMSSLPERKRVLKGPLSESRHIPYQKRALWSVEENLDFLLEARKLHGSNLTKLNHSSFEGNLVFKTSFQHSERKCNSLLI